MESSFPLVMLNLSKLTVNSEAESPLERALAAVTWPISFDPFGTSVPPGSLKLPAVSTSTASPTLSLLESSVLVTFTGKDPFARTRAGDEDCTGAAACPVLNVAIQDKKNKT